MSPAAGGSAIERNIRVLLAEDDPLRRPILRSLLETSGCRVDVVAGEAAIVAAMGGRFYDVVMLDLAAPAIDVPVLARLIRIVDTAPSRVPILAMVNDAVAADQEVWIAAGVNAVIGKAAEPSILIAAIMTLLPAPSLVKRPEPVLDEETLTQLETECDRSALGLFRLFLSECEKRLTRMEHEERDASFDMAREAHTLKGAAISFGCPALSASARLLEVAAESGDAAVDDRVRSVRQAYQTASAALGRRYPDLVQTESPRS